MSNKDIKSRAKIDGKAQELLNKAAKSLDVSARSYMKILKVARTIADLDNSEHIQHMHVAEALQYRKPDRRQFL